MIDKNALEYLFNQIKEVKTIEIDGKTYSTEKLNYVPPIFDETPCAESVNIKTLTGLVDYIKNKVDNFMDPLVVHIVSPTKVSVYSELRKDMKRSHFINCEAYTPEIKYEDFIDVEEFNIMLQSCFLESFDRAQILKVIGNIKEDNVRTIGDNGITQTVTAKSGIATVEDVIVPNPVTLYPFRTFAEVEQPGSQFIFRMQEGPKAALFEADGGKWRIFAMQNVKAYLTEKLDGCNVKIIS